MRHHKPHRELRCVYSIFVWVTTCYNTEVGLKRSKTNIFTSRSTTCFLEGLVEQPKNCFTVQRRNGTEPLPKISSIRTINLDQSGGTRANIRCFCSAHFYPFSAFKLNHVTFVQTSSKLNTKKQNKNIIFV